MGFKMKDTINAVVAVPVCLVLLAACAAPSPSKLSGDEDHAVLYTTPVNCVAVGACVSRVQVQAINGDAVQKLTTQYNYKVPPGALSIIVKAFPVLGEGRPFVQGICELKINAKAGTLYYINREDLDRSKQAFFIHARLKDGKEVATCTAPFSR